MTLPELAIGEPANLDETIQTIARAAQATFSADICLVVAINPITHRLIESPFVTGNASGETSAGGQLHLNEIVSKTLDRGLALLHRSIDQEKAELDEIGLPDISSLAAVVLHTPNQRKPLAVLFVGHRNHHSFDAAEQEDLKSFAHHAALTLKNTWLLRRYREVARIGHEINQSLEETHETLFEKLRTRMAEIIDTSYFLLLVVHQPRKPELSAHSAEVKFVDLYMSERGKATYQRVAPEYPIFRDANPKLIRRYDEEVGKTVQNLKQIEGTEQAIPQSLIFVPLIFRDDSFGLLSVQHISPDVYDDEDLQLLELIGNQVAQALANRRMYHYLDSLDKAGRELTQQLDSETLFREVVNRIREASEADIVALYPYNQKRPDDDRFIMPPHTCGEILKPDFPKPRVNQDDIARLVLEKDEPIFKRNAAELYEALGGDPKNRMGNFEEREQIKSTAALALKIGNETVGVLFVNYRIRQRFDAPQKALILGLANYAAIAIRNSRLLDQRHFLERLSEIDRAISSSLDLQQVLDTILAEATKVVPADEAAILLYDDRERALRAKAAIGDKTEERLQFGYQLDRGKGLTFWAYKNKKTIRVGNVKTDPKWKDIYNPFSDDTVSEIDVPLLDGDKVIGVINFESRLENAYAQADEDFITSLAAQAVVAVKNAQMYEREEQIAFELLAMQEIEREIVSHLNLKDLLEMILDKALKLTQSSAGHVLLYDPKQNILYHGAERGVVEAKYEKLDLKEGEGIAWEAIRQKKLLNIDLRSHELKHKFIPTVPNVKWELVVPIPGGDEFRGVINIESEAENPFTERDESLLSRLADLASIALQNAEQYEEAEKGRRRLEALRKVDIEIISQQEDPYHVIRVILESAGWLTAAEIAGLHFYEEGLPGKTYLSKEKKKDGRQSQWEPISRETSVTPLSEQRPGIVDHVFRTGEPYLTQGDAQDDPKYLGDSETHSEVAVPLKLRDKVIAVLNLESQRKLAFDQDDVAILELLAGQAVIAIQNALNLSNAKFRLLLEVGRELGEISAPEQKESALEIVFNNIREHIDGQIIYRRYDPNREVFVLEKFERLRDTEPPYMSKNDGINGQVGRERRAILVQNIDKLEEGIDQPYSPPNIKTLIVAPVIFEARYYGNLTLRHEQAGFYQESDRLLLDGFAMQLAITLRRLEAIEEQQEAEQQAKHFEIFSDLGQSAYELTHRLGNDLGLVKKYVNQIRDILIAQDIVSTVIDDELSSILKDVGRVLGMSKVLKTKVAGLREGGKPVIPSNVMPVKALLEEAKWTTPTTPPNLALSWEMLDDLGEVKVVTGQIIDILSTLVTNAIEAMPDGGQIIVKAYKSDSDICIEVTDNGPGISPANRKKIFNLFFSTKNSSGFGLWSARRYAHANGGDLTMKSELGKGTTFTLRLPLVRPRNGRS